MKIIMLLLLSLLWGCSDQPIETEQPEQSVQTEFGIANLEQQKWQDEVVLTIPKQFVTINMATDLDGYKKQTGISQAAFDEETGELQLGMTKNTHEQLLQQLENNIKTEFNELVKNNEASSIREVVYNEKFTQIDVTVEPINYKNSFESFKIFNMLSHIAYYKIIKNNATERIDVRYIDVTTNEIFETKTYFE